MTGFTVVFGRHRDVFLVFRLTRFSPKHSFDVRDQPLVEFS